MTDPKNPNPSPHETASKHVNDCVVPSFAVAEAATDRALRTIASLILDMADAKILLCKCDARKDFDYIDDCKIHGNAFAETNHDLARAIESIGTARRLLADAHLSAANICEMVAPEIIILGGGGGGK